MYRQYKQEDRPCFADGPQLVEKVCLPADFFDKLTFP